MYRRTIMVTCDLARAALIALVPFVGIAVLFVIAFVHESISLFFLPARDASVPLLVPERGLAEANGLILTELSELVIHSDEMVQGLKRHWLLKSAFGPATNAEVRSIVQPRIGGGK